MEGRMWGEMKGMGTLHHLKERNQSESSDQMKSVAKVQLYSVAKGCACVIS